MEFVGLVFPLFVEVLNRDIQNDDEKILICILTCIIGAVVIDWNLIVSGNYHNLHSVLILAFLLFGESQVVFKLFWKPVLQEKVQKLIGASSQGGGTG